MWASTAQQSRAALREGALRRLSIGYAVGTLAGSAQAADLAVQRRLQALEHAFDAPALAMQRSNLLRSDCCGQVAPQPDHAFACLRGQIQRKFDAPP